MNKQTPFKEAVMAAYVTGWYDGRAGITNDDKKHAVAAELAERYPVENAAPGLLRACETVAVMIERCDPQQRHPATGAILGRRPAAQAQLDILRAPLAKAKGD